METFESPSSREYVEYDAMGNVLSKASPDYDPEAQAIRDEFKRPF